MSKQECGDCVFFFDCYDAGDCTDDHKPCKHFKKMKRITYGKNPRE